MRIGSIGSFQNCLLDIAIMATAFVVHDPGWQERPVARLLVPLPPYVVALSDSQQHFLLAVVNSQLLLSAAFERSSGSFQSFLLPGIAPCSVTTSAPPLRAHLSSGV